MHRPRFPLHLREPVRNRQVCRLSTDYSGAEDGQTAFRDGKIQPCENARPGSTTTARAYAATCTRPDTRPDTRPAADACSDTNTRPRSCCDGLHLQGQCVTYIYQHTKRNICSVTDHHGIQHKAESWYPVVRALQSLREDMEEGGGRLHADISLVVPSDKPHVYRHHHRRYRCYCGNRQYGCY